MSNSPLLQLCEIGLTYAGPPPVHALRSCTAIVHSGDYIAVVGPSGSGKSTFLNVIGLLDKPTQGQYYLDGADTSQMSDRERTLLRSRHIGFVFQAFHLLPYRTATENVALPLMYHGVPRDTRLKAADEALADVGLFHRRQMLSTKLSGGERQRVAIARALVTKPSLVLCDEPTGNLDSASAERVLDILDRLNHAGMTLMVVTHDSSVAGRAQRCWKIADGQMKEAVR